MQFENCKNAYMEIIRDAHNRISSNCVYAATHFSPDKPKYNALWLALDCQLGERVSFFLIAQAAILAGRVVHICHPVSGANENYSGVML